MFNKIEQLPVLPLDVFDTDNVGFIVLAVADFIKISHLLGRPHKTGYYSVLYCKDGSCKIMVENEPITIASKTIVCIGKNSVCRWYNIEILIEGYIILFSNRFFSLRYNENVLSHFDCLKNNQVGIKKLTSDETIVWDFYWRQMKKEYDDWHKDSIPILRSHLNIILTLLEKNEGKKVNRMLSGKTEKFRVFEDLVERHFAEQRLPSFYARKLFISVNYLNRICKENSGSSSGEIIRNRVITESERLLFHTFKSVSEISIELGFESLSYFTTFFKRYTGLTPESFRKKNKNNQ